MRRLHLRPYHPAHRVTTAHLQGLYPWVGAGGLGLDSVYIGQDRFGGSFCYDMWELYSRGVIKGSNLFIFGEQGYGKSALAKTLVWRQLAFGRRAFIVDARREWLPLCEAAGVTPLCLERGGRLRVNPLDLGLTGPGRSLQDRRAEQVQVLAAILGASLERRLSAEELLASEVALTEATRITAGNPTLREVVDALLEPSDAAAIEAHAEVDDLRHRGREVGVTLRRLVEGDLRGMFDGPTSPGIDLDAPIVCFDISAIFHDRDALGMAMACLTLWLDRALAHDDGRQKFLVIDEAWAMLRHLEVVRFLQSSWKVARRYGVQNIAILHRLSDLTAAGAAGSEQVSLAQGLLADSETRVIYRQAPEEVARARELLGLSDVEAALVPQLGPGVGLWKVGKDHSFIVEHRRSSDEMAMVSTDERMRATRR